MKTSCIRQPENNRYIQLHEWQLNMCQNNHCAGLLLSLFLNWHEWKVLNDKYYSRANNIAEMHGDGRPHEQNAYLFFTVEELIAGCMNFYGKDTINNGLRLLESLNVITIHKNPNPRYHFDKTKYFKFYPDVCNDWIANNYPNPTLNSHVDMQVVDFSDQRKVDDRWDEISRPSKKTSLPAAEISRAITNTTNNTTNKNQSLNVRDDFSNNGKKENTITEDIKPIMDALVEKGMACKHFYYPDVASILKDLKIRGATLTAFVEAYDLSLAAAGQGFGIRYLAKVVEDLLSKSSKRKVYPSHSPPTPILHDYEVYEKRLEKFRMDGRRLRCYQIRCKQEF
jgi:hypothetical protein